MPQLAAVTLAMLMLIIAHGSTLVPRKPAQTRPSELTIDLAQCKPGSFGFPRALGSEQVVVKRRRKNSCVLRYTREIEGGYIERECQVPISLITLDLAGGEAYLDDRTPPFSKDISKYCKVTVQGSVFFTPSRRMRVRRAI